jgi:hypothetical protein
MLGLFDQVEHILCRIRHQQRTADQHRAAVIGSLGRRRERSVRKRRAGARHPRRRARPAPATIAFYGEVLGLRGMLRMPFGLPGARLGTPGGDGPRFRRRRIAPFSRPAYFAVGITNSAPLPIEPGQRCITALYRE